MSRLSERLNGKKERDIRILRDFVAIFCRENHGAGERTSFSGANVGLPPGVVEDSPLCSECSRLLQHGITKLLLCPYDPKPMCKKCRTHCYAPGYREKMRRVMRFSGMYLIKRGRLDLLLHYAF